MSDQGRKSQLGKKSFKPLISPRIEKFKFRSSVKFEGVMIVCALKPFGRWMTLTMEVTLTMLLYSATHCPGFVDQMPQLETQIESLVWS